MDRRGTYWIAGIVALSLGGAALAREAGEFTPSQQSHWAWKKPVRAALPRVANRAWVANPIDAFILSRLEAQKLKPAPTATREQLLRRVAFDLTGLPPAPTEIEAFLSDRTPTAWEKVVDHYLASPAFGERWGRHWLDLARYADSNGYEFDEARPDAWRYRDYVVRSLNADKPYDRFIQEQLAGDELAPDDPDALIATGFNLLGPDMTDAADQAARRQNTLNDMTDTAALTFLGLTLGCARCHDHKYEPLLAADYYRFQSFFVAAKFRNDVPAATPEQKIRFGEEQAAYESAVKSARGALNEISGSAAEQVRKRKIAGLPEDLQTAFNTPPEKRTTEVEILVDRNAAKVEPKPEEIRPLLPANLRAQFDQRVTALRAAEAKRPAPLPRAIVLQETSPEAPKTFILERGELSNRAAEVGPGYPIILTHAPPTLGAASDVRRDGAARPTTTGRRTALARWIASKDNPLTARVMVNRVWQHLLGRGIVPTPSDFGVRGDSPTHPELLDYLANAFSSGELDPNTQHPTPNTQRRTPWSIKGLIRTIVLSNTYKQSSQASAAALKLDPDNELFSRMNRKRLEGEAIRDAVLALSGRLNPKMGGPGVYPPIPAAALPPKASVWPVSKDPADQTRRSLYTFVRRNLQFPALEVFDAPDTNASCARREVTTSAPQALSLLNAPEMAENARTLAARVMKEAPNEAARVPLAYRLTLARSPTAQEAALARGFLERQAGLLQAGEKKDAAYADALADFCLALMNLNEFVYLD